MALTSRNQRRTLFWRCYRTLAAFIALAVVVPAALIIPAHQGRLQEQALEGATKTIEAASLTILQAFASGKTAVVEQQIVTLRQRHPAVGLAFVTGWTGQIIAHSDRREAGKLFLDFVPPPVTTVTRMQRRSDDSPVAEVTVPLHVNGEPRGAFRAEINLPAVERQTLPMLLLFAALGGTLLGVAILVASQLSRTLSTPYVGSLPRLATAPPKPPPTAGTVSLSKETLLRAMTDSSPLAALVVDESSGKVLGVNQAFCKMWGFDDLAVRLRRGVVEYEEIALRARALAGEAAFPSLRGGRPAKDHRALSEDELSLTDGRTLRRFSTRIANDKDEYLARMSLFEDVTAHKRNEAELGAARDEALAAARAKSELQTELSSKLRTPASALIGTTELLRGTPLSSEQRDYADSVRQSAEALLASINNMVDFSRIQAGQLELEVGPFDLHALVEGVVDRLGVAAHRKGLELAYWIDPSVPRAVAGDAELLQQVLRTVVGNAVSYTERGEVVLALHTVPADGLAAIRIGSDGSKSVRTNGRHNGSDHVTLRFEIKDTGIGISPERQSHLFHVPTPGNGSSRASGSGLGLVIAKHVVGMMDGEIGVESAPGHGSLFWFTVVLRADPAAAGEIAAAHAFDGNRLLVVDDNATARALLERQLDTWGLPHDSAASGGEGLKRLRVAADRGTPYTLALVDLEMPSMDGDEMSRIVSNDPQLGGLRLLLLTPAGCAPADGACEKTVAGTVTKPVGASRLYEALVSALL